MKPKLSDLEALARQAGDILRAGFGKEMHVDYKSRIDPVTEVDHRSEAFLIGEIQRRFPDDHIVSEESGELEGHGGGRWYIDPLDGTVNFAHGVPIFTVSIAYAENGRITLGAVYDPMQDEMFNAEAGRGALLNGKPIQVSQVESLERSLLVTGFPYDVRTNPDNNLDFYVRFMLLSQGVRRLGSAALDLCYVAAGRLDGFWELRINTWDIAAGGLIAHEAGAVVTDIRGGADYLAGSPSVLAANRHLHALMLEELGKSNGR